jgi:hypothetical protein
VIDPIGQERCINLAENAADIQAAIERHRDVRLVVIDPVSAYLGDAKSHDNASIRGLLTPYVRMAQDKNLAIILITHLNKTQGQDAISRFIGSIGMVAAARAAYMVIRQPDNEETRLFLPVKNNLGNDRTGISFVVEGVTLDNGIETSRICWRDFNISIKADAVLNGESATPRNAHAKEVAMDFLRDALAEGERSAGELSQEAEEEGISKSALNRARKDLNIQTRKQGKGAWMWRLPPENLLPTHYADLPNDFDIS